jgi:hypothetical protein
MLIHLDSRQYHWWIQDMRMPELKIIDPVFNINYDLEQQDKNEWLLHINAGVLYGEKGEFDSYNTFKALCSEEEIFTQGMLLPALKKSVEYSRRRLRTEMRTYEADCPPVKKVPKDFWEQLTGKIIGQYHDRGKMADEDPALNAVHDSFRMSYLITRAMRVIFNMISLEHPFKGEENRKLFFQFVPEYLWKRLYFKCHETDEDIVKLTVRETVMLYYCIDCAAHCMAGKHFPKIMQSVYGYSEAGKQDRETERKNFVSLAEEFKENILSNLPSAAFKIADFNTAVSWSEHIAAF